MPPNETLNLLLQVTSDTSDGEQGLAGLVAALRAFAGEDAEAEADVSTATAEKKIKALHQSLRDVGAETVTPKAEVSTGNSESTILGLRARLAAIPNEHVDIELDTSRATKAAVVFRQAVLTAVSSLQVQAVFAIAALGGAAIAAGAAVAGIGAAALAAIAPFGILALAVKNRLKKGGEATRLFKEELDGLKHAFSDAMGPAADAVLGGLTKGLASVTRMLPKLKGEFTALGKESGAAIRALAREFTSPAWTRFFKTMIAGSTQAVKPFSMIISDLGRIFRNLATAGLPVFIDLLGKGAKALQGIAERTSDIEALRAKIREGVAVLGALWDIAKNLLVTLKAVFDAGQSAGFLISIRNATAEIAKFAKSAEGQDALKELFAALVPFVEQLVHAIPALVPALARVLAAANTLLTGLFKLAELLNKIPVIGPSLSAIAIAFLAWKGPLSVASGLIGGISKGLLKLSKQAITKSLVPTAGAEAGAGAAGGAAGGATGGVAGLASKLGPLAGLALAATAAFLVLQRAFGTFKAALVIVSAPIGLLVIYLGTLLKAVKLISPAVRAAADAIAGAFRAAVGGVTTAATAVFTAVVTAINASAGAAATAATAVFEAVKTAITATTGAIKSAASAVLRAVIAVVRGYVGAGVGAARAVFDGVRRGVLALLGAVKGAAHTVLRGAIAVVRGYIAAGVNAGRAVFDGVKRGVAALLGAVKGAAHTVARGAIEVVRGYVDNALAAGRAIGDKVGDGIRALAGRVGDAASAVARKGVDAIRGTLGAFTNIGRSIIEALVAGVKSAAGKLGDAAVDAIKGAIGKAKGVLHIGSPSKVFLDIGKNISRSTAEGIRKLTPVVDAQVRLMTGSAIDVAHAGLIAPSLALPADVAAGTTSSTTSHVTHRTENHYHIDALIPNDQRIKDLVAATANDGNMARGHRAPYSKDTKL